ncbi:hypothetical protein PHAVU_005G017600 [Phaseolus vulgaris]|uniref:Uncharacterized protein n=1 Tax=Phaseolus vulgaris TaxID=3885 RepID=V7BS89_PHAVU|nr:hypothetical protein PHAVU_005G017600g [Phaseolus vulgaris]ESW20824.1 hypothetical protein PHAVU_005G017600g [Phaseolus vulgaris]
MLYTKMETSRKSSLMLAFLLAFFIISSDMIMNSEAARHAIGRCNSDTECEKHCPKKCGSCSCVRRICFCEKLSLTNNTPSF